MMSDEAIELAKQFVLYADAITAFSVVQMLGFIYLLAHGDCFTMNVMRFPAIPIIASAIVNGVYLFLVWSCHNSEDRILGPPSSKGTMLAPLLVNIRRARYTIIIAALYATVIIFGLVSSSIAMHTFFIDCKGTS